MMKRLLLALAFAAWGFIPQALPQGTIVGPGNLVICPFVATLAAGTSSSAVQIVAAVSGQRVSICGWHVTNTASTGTFGIQVGTGSNCGSNSVTVVPAQNVSSSAPATDHIDYAFYTSPLSNALCIVPSATTVAGVVYYNQF